MNIAEIFIYRHTPKGSIFSYEIPDDLLNQIEVGRAVEVSFGRFPMKGIVWNIKKDQPKPDFTIKPISKIIGKNPVISATQKKLIEWIAEYYFSSLLAVVKTVLPSFLLTMKQPRMMKDKKNTQEGVDITLTNDQQQAVDTIIKSEQKKFLLHGVTGSGKTEVYMEVIKKNIEQGKQALMLVPEISLTPQTIARFQRFFPYQEIAVWHSHLSKSEKHYYWNRVRNNEIKLVIGSRSAIFSPFQSLGLIVIDEEQEDAYKQEQSPRYDARTVAEKISEYTGCKIIFGSATPSIETYHFAKSGEFKLLELKDRVTDKSEQNELFLTNQLPEVTIVDLRKEKKDTVISRRLHEAVDEALQNKEITFLFLNRRGFSPYFFCRDCGQVVMCQNCAVPMTFHRKKDKSELICHHCGIVNQPISLCPSCSSHNVAYGGIGTQKVEGEVKKIWPDARVYRIDSDTMGKKNSYDELYQLLNQKKIDILIGTQMVTKGWDIPNVTTIGIISADVGLHLPDFRAGENTFQLLSQVAGRAGRRGEKSKVFCQTYNPENSYIQKATEHDYQSFYNEEIELRKAVGYSPFSKLIRLVFEHKDEQEAENEAQKIAEKIQELIKTFDMEFDLPCAVPCFISKSRNKYRWQIIIKVQSEKFKVKSYERNNENNQIIELLKNVPAEWKIDIDPINML